MTSPGPGEVDPGAGPGAVDGRHWHTRHRIGVVDDVADDLERTVGWVRQRPDLFRFVGAATDLAGLGPLGHYDAIVCDLYLHGTYAASEPSWEHLARLTQRVTRVLVLSTSERDEDVFEVTERYDVGFATKGDPVPTFHRMLELVCLGEWQEAVTDRWAASIINEFRRRDRAPRLTDQQWQILRLIGRGYSNTEIETRLCISENTRKSHVRSLRRALRVPPGSDRMAPWRKAREWRLVDGRGQLSGWVRPRRRHEQDGSG